eukprot:11646004-Prorocentrum_lima.AAC.1
MEWAITKWPWATCSAAVPLLALTGWHRQALEAQVSFAVIIFDLSKAFDTAPREPALSSHLDTA